MNFSNFTNFQLKSAIDFTIIALDFETTGKVKGYSDEAWQIGYITVKKGEIARETAVDRLLGVGDRPFNKYAPGRHAELKTQLLQAKSLGAYWPEIKKDLGKAVLCAHNASTEINVLKRAFPLHKFGPWIDTLKLSRLLFEGLENYKLETVIKALHFEDRLHSFFPDKDYHDALFDAMASALILEYILKEFPDIPLENLVNPEMGEYYKRRAKEIALAEPAKNAKEEKL